jgi:rsbT co-antagonist protein RsbR
MHKDYVSQMKIDERELASRRAFFDLGDEDLARLAALRPLAERCTDEIVERFYDHLLAHHETRRFLPDQATVRRVKRLQRDYFLDLFSGSCDLAYVERRLRVGAAHERIGLAPKWYIGAYRLYLTLLFERIMRDVPDAAEARPPSPAPRSSWPSTCRWPSTPTWPRAWRP